MNSESSTLSFQNTAAAIMLVLIAVLSTVLIAPEISKRLLISAVRCFVQIQLLTFAIRPVFAARSLNLTLGISTILLVFGVLEILKAQGYNQRRKLCFRLFFCLLLFAGPLSIFASRFALGHQPWWLPKQFLPFFGMLIGNNISCMAVGVSHAFQQIEERRDQIETLLSYGALPREVILNILLPKSIQLSCLPTLNQMSIAGLVTIPGAMTGAILGGASIEQAALLQINLLFILTSSSVFCTLTALLVTYSHFFDGQSRLHSRKYSMPNHI